MGSLSEPLHFVLFPFMAQGHLIPMTDIARLLAQRGVIVTIVTTPVNAARVKPTLNHAIESGLQIHIVEFPFLFAGTGIPEGCETFDKVPKELTFKFLTAVNSQQQHEQVEKWFGELIPSPSCIISDFTLYYTRKIADKLQIPRITFKGFCGFSILCNHILYFSDIQESISSDSEYFTVPGLSEKFEFTKAQVPMTAMRECFDLFTEDDLAAYGEIINTFEELESAYVEEFRKRRGGKVWCLGPVSLSHRDTLQKSQRGGKAAIDGDQCLTWLDTQEKGSAVYVCLGSLCNMIPAQLIELGLGLEASNRPFIWVLGEGDSFKPVYEWIENERFEQRIKGRGLVIRGWAPQLLILSHPAVGGFLTHCGWNSTLEGISSGVPMITWPLFGDQFCNQKVVVQVAKTGVRSGVEQPLKFGEEEKIGVLVKKEGVKNAIDKLMDGGKEGEERRNRAKELQEMAKKAVEVGGSSYQNITLLIQDIMQHSQYGTFYITMGSLSEPLHFVLFPFMAQGHLIPMTDIARLLAQRGVIVTIVTTPVNAARVKPTLNHAIESGLQIHIIEFPFLFAGTGIPVGCETFDKVPTELALTFLTGVNSQQQHEQVEKWFEELVPSPSCIISDFSLFYTRKIADKFQIPRITFKGFCGFSILCNLLAYFYDIRGSISSDCEYFTMPGLSEKFEFTKAQVPITAPDLKKIFDLVIEDDLAAYGEIINTFEELESTYVEEFRKRRGGKVWCLGPVSLSHGDTLQMSQRGGQTAIDEDQCLKWLGTREKGSVVYVCLGSLCNMVPAQLIELGLGLEASNRPFIWVLRESDNSKGVNKWIEEEGFEQRTKDRGLLIRGWSPQLLILSHPAVGGFLTHCGWNSTLEGICSGMPMITWPLFGDQFCNEKVVVQVAKTGVRSGVEKPLTFGEEEKIGVQLKKEEVKKAIDELMDGGEEGEERRKRAKQLAEKAKKAVEVGGSSYQNITHLIQDIMQHSKHETIFINPAFLSGLPCPRISSAMASETIEPHFVLLPMLAPGHVIPMIDSLLSSVVRPIQGYLSDFCN